MHDLHQHRNFLVAVHDAWMHHYKSSEHLHFWPKRNVTLFDNFVVCGSNQDVCSKFAILATISGTNPLMKLAVAPNLDHGQKGSW